LTSSELNKNDQLWRDFIDGCLSRLAESLRDEFGTLIGPLDEMLEIAHETAVIIAIEVGTPPLADPIFNIFEKVIKEIWIPKYSPKRAKRHRN